jgi:hypothetical protein
MIYQYVSGIWVWNGQERYEFEKKYRSLIASAFFFDIVVSRLTLGPIRNTYDISRKGKQSPSIQHFILHASFMFYEPTLGALAGIPFCALFSIT